MTNKEELKEVKSDLLIDIFTKVVILPGENHRELNKIKDEIKNDLKPEGAIEDILCSKIIVDTWKLKRLYFLEARILKEQQVPKKPRQEYDDYDLYSSRPVVEEKTKRFRSTIKQIYYTKELEDIQRHQSIIEGNLIKTISELKEIQKRRIKK